MSSPTADIVYLCPDLPEALNEFRLDAPQILKGGIRKDIALIKRPPSDIREREDGRVILAIWDDWWRKTTWGEDPQATNPRWNSPTRSGHIWTHFGEASHALNGRPYVYCLNCGNVLQHPTVKTIGTKHLLNHLNSRTCRETQSAVHNTSHIHPPFLKHQKRQVSILSPAYSQQAFEKELVRVIIDGNWSFRTVERPSFQRFLSFLRPDTIIPSRYQFTQSFREQFNIAKSTLLQDLGKATKISIVLDAWSASNHLNKRILY
jgi:hypothetical protein